MVFTPEQHRLHRLKLKAKNLCITCRHKPARKGQTKCEECATHQLTYILSFVAKCKEEKLCYDCQRELKPEWGITRCPVCQQHATEQINISRRLNV